MSIFTRAASGTVIGVDAHPVEVECHRGKGLPQLLLIGLARGAVRESAVRVRSAIMACGVPLGTPRWVVNLLPAELPKEASALDLALAVALLSAAKVIPAEALQGRRFFGELSLGATLEPVRGACLVADLSRRWKDEELIVPLANAEEAAVIPGVRVRGAERLGQVIMHLRGEALLPEIPRPTKARPPLRGCFSEVHGQRIAKRGLEIAAAGGHNILLVGPPGSGKTMLARRLPGILPELGPEASIEVTRIHSAAGLLGIKQGLVSMPPFRAPHHTASEAALCGGGSLPRPGEITLAHQGVLFLDEFPEFSRRALESLREPLEEGQIHIARAAMSLCFPARVLLVAAMNPCPCGRFQAGGSLKHPCLCSLEQVRRYRARISGPLLDRIDLHVSVQAVAYRDFARANAAEESGQIRSRICAARARQHQRIGAERVNASLNQPELRRLVPLDADALSLIEVAMEDGGLSTRAVGRVLKVARTIADLEGTLKVSLENLREALSFRLLERQANLLEVSAV